MNPEKIPNTPENQPVINGPILLVQELLDKYGVSRPEELPSFNDDPRVSHLKEYLSEDDKVVYVNALHIDKLGQKDRLWTIPALRKLTHTAVHEIIGSNGPSDASTSHEEAPDEVKKFESLFGRDSIIIADLLGDIYPKLTPSTIIALAEKQGVDHNYTTGEQPGGILHDDHDPDSPLAKKFIKDFNWDFPFYATVDATPMFASLTAKYAKKRPEFLNQTFKNRLGNDTTVLEALDGSMDWLERNLSKSEDNPEGLLEFNKIGALGLDNHAWRDSYHAYVHRDGRFANHDKGIASVEVQAYAYDALLDTAELREAVGSDKSSNLRARADQLRQSVIDKFWIPEEDGGYFALGTDRDDNGELRQLDIVTSNMARLLDSRFLEGDDPDITEKRNLVVKKLFSPDMLNISGVRTVSNSEQSFNPYSYHNGGVWPHDTALIARGLQRHGFFGLAAELNRRIINNSIATNSLAELFQGGDNDAPTMSTTDVYVYNPSINKETLYLAERTPQFYQGWVGAAVLRAKAQNPFYGLYNPDHEGESPVAALKKPLRASAGTPERQLEDELLANIGTLEQNDTKDGFVLPS